MRNEEREREKREVSLYHRFILISILLYYTIKIKFYLVISDFKFYKIHLLFSNVN